jgi:hypothetical protein
MYMVDLSKKYISKNIKMSKIGAMFKSFLQLASPAWWFSIRILLFGYMELGYHLSYADSPSQQHLW